MRNELAKAIAAEERQRILAIIARKQEYYESVGGGMDYHSGDLAWVCESLIDEINELPPE